jgi:hypothetical protein
MLLEWREHGPSDAPIPLGEAEEKERVPTPAPVPGLRVG